MLISARVGDSRLAQQRAGLFGGVLKAGPEYYALIGGLVLVLDLAIVFSARRLFDRERLMSRWG